MPDKFKSSFTLQQGSHSISFPKQRRFSKGYKMTSASYVGVNSLPSTHNQKSAHIMSSKKIFMQPYQVRNAQQLPSSQQYNLRKTMKDYKHGRSFTTGKKFDTKQFIQGLRVKDIDTIKREPSVHEYNIIPKTIGKGRYMATFEHKGKMFNEQDQDCLHTPSP